MSKDVDIEGFDAFMTFSYVPAPLTGYRDVKQLLPGQWLLAKATPSGSRLIGSSLSNAPKFREPNEELLEEFEALFQRVIERQMVADVPVGCFLSGGIDSFGGDAHDARRQRPPYQSVLDGLSRVELR